MHIMPAENKYDFHGVEVPNNLRVQFQRWADAALVRRSRSPHASATSSQLSKSQQTRLNKKMAKAIAAYFLSVSPHTADILTAYQEAGKKDDMADALLQALAYANAVLPEGVMQGWPPCLQGSTAVTAACVTLTRFCRRLSAKLSSAVSGAPCRITSNAGITPVQL